MTTRELRVAVQMLFTSSTEDGVVVDCTVAEEVVTESDRRIPPGSPFSLLIDAPLPSSATDELHASADSAVLLLERWCDMGAVVEATTTGSDNCLVLCHLGDRVVLEIL